MSHIAQPTVSKVNVLDLVPPFVRHALILAIAAGLTWLSANLDQLHLAPTVAIVVGTVVTLLLLVLTPITGQYGVGKQLNSKAQERADLDAAVKIIEEQAAAAPSADAPPAPPVS